MLITVDYFRLVIKVSHSTFRISHTKYIWLHFKLLNQKSKISIWGLAHTPNKFHLLTVVGAEIYEIDPISKSGWKFWNTVLGISGRSHTHSRDININMDVIRSITAFCGFDFERIIRWFSTLILGPSNYSAKILLKDFDNVCLEIVFETSWFWLFEASKNYGVYVSIYPK